MTALSPERASETPSSEPDAAAASAARRSPVHEGQHRLRLGIAEAAVVLEHPRAVSRQHQADEQGPDERCASARELGEHGLDRVRDERVGVDVGDGGERAHAPGVRPEVAVVRPLEVPRGRQSQRPDSVADGEDRELRPVEQLLHDDVVPERAHGREALLELVVGSADDDALPRREPVRLQDARNARRVEQRRRGHSGGGHHLLRESLRAFDPSRGR